MKINWYKTDNKIVAHVEGKTLIIMRGLPGSGKSSLAKSIAGDDGVIFSTDDLFEENGVYKFDSNKLRENHIRNRDMVNWAMSMGEPKIVLDNTNVTSEEIRPYVEMANKYGYKIVFQEPDTEWKFDPVELAKKNKHGVPEDIIRDMVSKWEDTSLVRENLGVD